jgi:hypothetical protein
MGMGLIAGIGSLVFLIGWIWLIVVGFQVGGVLWGILNIFFQPVTGLIFCIVKKAGWTPFILMIIGIIMVFGFGGASFVSNYPGVN